VTSEPAALPHPEGPGVPDARAARRAFLAAVLRNPGQVGAIMPSSRRMARLLTTIVPRTGSPVVVELGPGTGAVTGVIDACLPRDARHLAVELDPAMAVFLQRMHPDLEVIEGDAVKLGALLAERDVDRADAVVSGLPWSLFDGDTQRSILGHGQQAKSDPVPRPRPGRRHLRLVTYPQGLPVPRGSAVVDPWRGRR
jgi:phosphatidylethanolamine/phosphatidyl-N-methylethanolamine N-methyltransferase